MVRSKKRAHCQDGYSPAFWDLQHESRKESRNGGISGLPFLTFMTSLGQVMFHMVLSHFQLKFNLSFSVFAHFSPFLPEYSCFKYTDFSSPDRRDQRLAAVLQLPVPFEGHPPESLRFAVCKKENWCGLWQMCPMTSYVLAFEE